MYGPFADVKSYYVSDENNIPQELLDAKAAGKKFQCLTIIGYIDTDSLEFRVGVNYIIKGE